MEQQAPAISWRVDEWFPDLDKEVGKKLKVFHEELLKHSKTINLVSLKTLPFSDALHFADSILACRIIYKNMNGATEIYDIGSGAGFPGVIFAILYPNVKVFLVDNDSRKTEFLSGLVKLLGLKNIEIVTKSVDALPENSIKVAMARGFASISKVCLALRRSVVKGGTFYHLKSEEWGIEVGEMPSQLCSIWMPSLVGEYKLPVGGVRFGVVKTDKIA